MNSKINKFFFEKNYIFVVLSVALGLVSSYYLYLGYLMRPLADDYCTLAVVKWYGFWETLVSNIGMRYGSAVFSYFVAMFGIGVYRWMVPFLLISVIILFLLFSRKLFSKLNFSANMVPIVFSLTFFVSLIALTPNKFQSVFWFGASTVYTWPIVFFLVSAYLYLAGIMARDERKKIALIILALLGFYLTFGFSEVFAMGMLPLLSAVAFFGILKKKKKLIYFFLPAIVDVLSVVTMFFMPARQQRLNMLADLGIVYEPTPFMIVKTSLSGLELFIKSLFRPDNLFIILVAFFIFAYGLLFLLKNKIIQELPNRILLSLFLLAAPFGIWFSLIPGYMVYGGGGPDRERVVAMFIVILATFILAMLITSIIHDYKKIPAMNYLLKPIPVLIFLALFSFASGYYAHAVKTRYNLRRVNVYKRVDQDVSFYRMISANFDKTDKYIVEQKKSGNENLVVSPIGLNEKLNDFVQDPGFWVNTCAARYYGVKEIRIP